MNKPLWVTARVCMFVGTWAGFIAFCVQMAVQPYPESWGNFSFLACFLSSLALALVFWALAVRLDPVNRINRG